MKARLFTIKDASSKRSVMTACWDYVSEAIHGGGIDITVARMSKTRAQEKKYHSMFADIARQVDFDGKRYSAEVWKAWLVDQFQQDMALAGTPLSKPGRSVMSLDGMRVVQIRPSTTEFRKGEASELIEFLFCFGAENNIEWRDPETQAMYRDYFERVATGG